MTAPKTRPASNHARRSAADLVGTRNFHPIAACQQPQHNGLPLGARHPAQPTHRTEVSF